MERWLTKSRVLVALCAVLLLAAFNRNDPMVFGMFLLLAVVSVLGFAVPWLSLRSMVVEFGVLSDQEVQEGQACTLPLQVRRQGLWPAFMVDVETEWEWASRRLVLRQTLPVVHAKQVVELEQLAPFPCRGRYELIALRMSTGFPLGLVRAEHAVLRPQLQVRVLPRSHVVHWPLAWDVADDPQGELTTRRVGQSYELGMLRPYQHGHQLGRINWRASARAGELVVQHFQHSGSIRLRMVVDFPREPMLGDAASAGEQVVRMAAGLGDAVLEHGVQLLLYYQHECIGVADSYALFQLLAEAESQMTLPHLLEQAAQDIRTGEQLAVVVACHYPALELISALQPLLVRGLQVVVCIALGHNKKSIDMQQALALQQVLHDAGLASIMGVHDGA